MRFSFLIIYTVIFFGFTADLEARLPDLCLLNNYFLYQNQTDLSVGFENIGIPSAHIDAVLLNLSYGVNTKAEAGLTIPFLWSPEALVGMVMGDIAGYLKILATQSDVLSWKLAFDLHFRLATGVSKTDGLLPLTHGSASLYPFSSGTSSLDPGFVFSLLQGTWIFNLSLVYHIENKKDSPMLTFDSSYDRIETQLSADYFFKWKVSSPKGQYVTLRPVLYLDYRQNISALYNVPSGLSMTLELNSRWTKVLRVKVGITLPLYDSAVFYRYHFFSEIGKTF